MEEEKKMAIAVLMESIQYYYEVIEKQVQKYKEIKKDENFTFEYIQDFTSNGLEDIVGIRDLTTSMILILGEAFKKADVDYKWN